MNLLKFFQRREAININVTSIVKVYTSKAKVARSIQVCIPVSSLNFHNLNLSIMTTQFGKASKAPYTLQWLDEDGNVTTDPVTGVQATNGDGTIAKAAPTDNQSGWIFGVADGVVDILFTGLASDGSTVNGKVTITISDAPPPVKVAKSIGVTVGDAVAQ